MGFDLADRILDRNAGMRQFGRVNGDEALAECTARFDGVTLRPDQFRIAPEALQAAHEQLDSTLLAALRQAIQNVRNYQQAITNKPPADWTRQGVRLGVRQRPLRRVGLCVPGASASPWDRWVAARISPRPPSTAASNR